MTQPDYLAARDLDSRAWKRGPMTRTIRTGDDVLDERLESLAHECCGKHDKVTVKQMLTHVVRAASSKIEEHDLEMMNRTIHEMLAAEEMFLPYRNIRKISCFGSARTKENDPRYRMAQKFSRNASERGYMVITGGGPGIMQACNEGATEHCSFGLNITLPFEQHANHVIEHSEKMMNFYYFFTRKLNFLKQTDALVAFPGGFGTMDEVYESITLMQTGKASLFPIVLLDPPGDTFWERWMEFVRIELTEAGLISPEDMSLIYMSKSPEDALAHIEHFYDVFHSYYFRGEAITIRLNRHLHEDTLAQLRENFCDLMPHQDMLHLAHGGSDDPEPLLAALPRISFSLKRGNYARLRMLIDVINND